MRRRNAQSCEVLGGSEGRVVRDRDCEAALPETELAQLRHAGARLGDQIEPGHPEFGDPVGHELDDVVGPHEEDVEIEVLHARHQRPLTGFEDEPGIAQQADGRLDQPALVWNCEAQATRHRGLSPVLGSPFAARSRSRARR